ncbi:GntR family transcriptional regulator [Scopulibacillus darangshiensis]|uniref:GntR family transcriptional regulator n=1 Tax=Scopulibacillus darangshiensis TaxID=442528 RepID=A0A4R2P4A2_9BACL|nr:PLP-dependent aminotransferase family protein [Scopulibacillus darangshiensis]TCP29630.1 GntR family transcriptional regulator [Scopulibacillus darangshiensis]
MILLTLDKNGEAKYIYQQIYEGIKTGILERKLKFNEKLPSKRELAGQLKVSVNSVANAYGQLLAEGYIYTIEKKGYYVENITQFIQQEDAVKDKLPYDLKEDIEDKEGWLSLSHMTSDISMFPFAEWMRCQNKAVKNHKKELSEILDPQGPYGVRETISRMLGLSRGVKCEPEQIIIGAGSQQLIRQLMAMQARSTVVAMEDPGYSRFYTLLKNMDFGVRPVKLDEKGIDVNDINATKANVVFVTPSHQFPTGKIMPISRRIQLLNWSAESTDRYIVEDDYDSEFKYETDNIPSLQSLDRNHRVIYTGTFSKTMFPGFRMSYMVLPPDLLRDYRRHYSDLMQYSNSLVLFTLHYFVESGGYARHVKRMNHHYEMKRRLLIKELHIRFRGDVDIEDVPAGLHFLAQFRTDKGYEEIEEQAKQEKLEIYSMRRFMLKNKYKEKEKVELVIGFANIHEEKIVEAVDRLYRVIKTGSNLPVFFKKTSTNV